MSEERENMRLAARTVLFIVCAVMLLTTSPSFGLNDGGCQACKYQSTADSSWVYCGSPEDGEWGASDCKVTCYQYGNNMGACSCSASGAGCLYIVVQG
jgi:hypothetical protein